MQQAAYDTTNAHQLQGNSNRSVGLQEASFPEYFPAGTFSGLDKPVQPQDSRVIQFPTVGKYTDAADDLDSARFAKAVAAHVSQHFPGTLHVDGELPAYKEVHEDDLPYAQVAHGIGLSPFPVAPSSHQRVEDNQALQLAFEGHPVRAIKDAEGKAWFIGADVCAILGYSDAHDAVKKHCKSPKLLRTGESPVLGINPRGMTIINRADVYRLIMRSQHPAAERFEAWVVEEVLPAIQDHGGYLTTQATEQALADPDFIIGLATKLKEERAKAAELEAENAKINAEKIRLAFEKGALAIAKDRLAHENSILKPKADMHDSLMEADGAIEMGDAAKVLSEDFPGIGRNKLFRFLRWYGVLVYTRQYTIPSQRYMNSGYFRVVMRRGRHFGSRAKSRFVYPQTYVKPEGMRYLHKLISKFYDGNTLRYSDDKAA